MVGIKEGCPGGLRESRDPGTAPKGLAQSDPGCTACTLAGTARWALRGASSGGGHQWAPEGNKVDWQQGSSPRTSQGPAALDWLQEARARCWHRWTVGPSLLQQQAHSTAQAPRRGGGGSRSKGVMMREREACLGRGWS